MQNSLARKENEVPIGKIFSNGLMKPMLIDSGAWSFCAWIPFLTSRSEVRIKLKELKLC